MNIQRLIDQIKAHPNADKIGMILCHNGIVRGTSREGRPVSGLEISVDAAKLADVLETHRKMPGIIDIQVEIAADRPLAAGFGRGYSTSTGTADGNAAGALGARPWRGTDVAPLFTRMVRARGRR